MSDRETIEAGLQRNYGMSPQRKEKLASTFEAQDDWMAFCRQCGKQLKGTLQQLKDHKCGTSS